MNENGHVPDSDPSDPDDFERAARSAGAELRRPAPPDGMQRLRSARRRRQVVSGVATAGALATVIGVGVFVMSDGERLATTPADTIESTIPSTDPGATPPPTVAPPTVPDTTEPPAATTTTAPISAPDTTALDEWLQVQADAGRTTVDQFAGEGTSAFGLTARNADGIAVAAAVLLDDGRIIDMPPEPGSRIVQTLRLLGLGDRIAIVDHVGDAPALWVLDPESGQWSVGPDLGLEPQAPGAGFTQMWWVDGSILIGRSRWVDRDDGITVPGDDRDGVIIGPDLGVVAVAAPPDGIQMEWTTVSGSRALYFGIEPGASNFEPFTQPWSLDVSTNTWSPIPLPPWLNCGDGQSCEWFSPHEFGDRFLEAVTSRGVVKRTPDGTVGIYDPETATWTRVDDAPFQLALGQVGQVDDRLVVAPVRAPYRPEEDGEYGQVGVLDLVSGTWTTTRFQVTELDALWEVRSDEHGVLIAPVGEFFNVLEPPLAALDTGTADWRPSQPGDAARWRRLETFFDLTAAAGP